MKIVEEQDDVFRGQRALKDFLQPCFWGTFGFAV
jgi:hypothetical protein